ncbi:MAG: glycosyltransferase family 39 protein [Spirochaetota bacterium]
MPKKRESIIAIAYERLSAAPYYWLSLAVTGILIIINFVWLRADMTPPPFDQAWYLETSQRLYSALVKDGIFGCFIAFTKALGGIKAPLLTALPLPFYLIFGNHQLAAMCVNFMFMLILTHSVFRIGEHYFGERAGFIAALVIQTMPMVYALSRQFFMEYALAAMVSLFVLFLIRSDNFTKRGYNTALGILFGLGMLTKITFPLYVGLPCLWALVSRWRGEKKFIDRAFIIEMVKIGAISFCIAAVWYVRNFKTTFPYTFSTSYGVVANDYGSEKVFALSTLAAYFTTIGAYVISYYYVVLGLLAVIALSAAIILRRKKKDAVPLAGVALLLLWLVTDIVFMSGRNKEIRYVVPLMPAFAILIGAGFTAFLPRMHHVFFLAVAALVLTLPAVDLVRKSFFIPQYYNAFYLHTPDRRDWHIRDVVEHVYRGAQRMQNASPYVIVAVEHIAVSANTLSYYAASRQYDSPIYFTSLGYGEKNAANTFRRINEFKPSFILFLDNSGDLTPFLNAMNATVRRAADNGEIPYRFEKRYELSFGPRIVLYRRTAKN